MNDDIQRLGGSIRRFYRRLAEFIQAIQDTDYIAAKGADFVAFTRIVLLITASFILASIAWDYAVDPVNAAHTNGLRVGQCLALLVWSAASWRHPQARAARLCMFLVPLILEGLYMQVMIVLDRGMIYGLGGFLYFFIFIPLLTVSQPAVLWLAVLTLITVFPIVMQPFGLSAGLDWPIYNAFMWLGFVPVVLIMLLFEYLYWNVYCYRRQVEIQAVTDGLTQIANRRFFITEAIRALELHQRHERTASLLFIDIDRFKPINDEYGHRVGDAALKHVVATLSPQLRASDLIGRYGGEEFVVFLPETGLHAAAQIGERMRAAIEARPYHVDSTDNDSERTPTDALDMTISIGVATHSATLRERPDIESLINAADFALYEAKRRGRNRVVSYTGPESFDNDSGSFITYDRSLI